jgi:hypothetical protein
MLSRFTEDIRETAILVLGEQLSHGEVAAILGVKDRRSPGACTNCARG